jgi:hypothetical protein
MKQGEEVCMRHRRHYAILSYKLYESAVTAELTQTFLATHTRQKRLSALTE